MNLEFKNLFFSYKTHYIIKKLSITLTPGKIHFIHGKNGSGKSTLLKLTAMFLKPDSGEILYDNIPFKDFRKQRKDIAYITHEAMIYPELTLEENINFFKKTVKNKIIDNELYKNFGLEKYKTLKLKNYSRGMKQKASLYISLLFDKEIYLFDEPFSGLDDASQQILKDYILKLSNKNKLIVLVSHHIKNISKTVNYNLENGKLKIID